MKHLITILCQVICLQSFAQAGFDKLDQFPESGGSTTPFGMTVTNSGKIVVVGAMPVGGSPVMGIAVRQQDLDGTWQTSKPFQLVDGKPCFANGTTRAPNGDLYLIGPCEDDHAVVHSIVRKSTDEGRTWKTVDLFAFPDKQFPFNRGYRVIAAPNGDIYTLTQVFNNFDYSKVTKLYSVIQRSQDDGETWHTMDTCEDCTLSGLAMNSVGALYAVGSLSTNYTPADNNTLVKKLESKNPGWQIVDKMPVQHGAIIGIYIDEADDIYVTGGEVENYLEKDKPMKNYAFVRKAHAASDTDWKTLHRHSMTELADTNIASYQVIKDHSNNLKYVGYGIGADGKYHWWLAEGDERNNKWNVTLDWNGTNGEGAFGFGIYHDKARKVTYSIGRDIQKGVGVWTVLRLK